MDDHESTTCPHSAQAAEGVVTPLGKHNSKCIFLNPFNLRFTNSCFMGTLVTAERAVLHLLTE